MSSVDLFGIEGSSGFIQRGLRKQVPVLLRTLLNSIAVDLSCIYRKAIQDYQILKNGLTFFAWAGLLSPKRLNVYFNFHIHYFILVLHPFETVWPSWEQ